MVIRGSRRAAVVISAMIGLTLVTTWAFGHLCNNIYRTPDRVIVKPEKPTATVVGTEEFRVFVQNNYPTYLDNLRLGAKLNSSDTAVSVTPESVKRLKAGERTAFLVKLTSKPGVKASRSTLAFSISADNIDWKPVTVTSTEGLRSALKSEDNLSAAIQTAEFLVARRDQEGTKYLTNIAGDRKADRDYRARSTRALGKGGDKRNIAFLRALLPDPDGFVRGNALLSLGLLGDQASTFAPLYSERDEFVRYAAMSGRVLAGGREPSLLKNLSQGLSSSNSYVRIACAWGLASRRDKAAIAVLDRDFTTDDAMQRTTAGDALVDVANRR
ncbi:MAG: HEAT repeat domain-containing protein [Armatimonadota bacterium]